MLVISLLSLYFWLKFDESSNRIWWKYIVVTPFDEDSASVIVNSLCCESSSSVTKPYKMFCFFNAFRDSLYDSLPLDCHTWSTWMSIKWFIYYKIINSCFSEITFLSIFLSFHPILLTFTLIFMYIWIVVIYVSTVKVVFDAIVTTNNYIFTARLSVTILPNHVMIPCAISTARMKLA